MTGSAIRPRFDSGSERFLEALRVAATLHAGRARKKTDMPDVGHLLGTCSIAMEFGANEDQAIAALLHDTIEDVEPVEKARAAVDCLRSRGAPDRRGLHRRRHGLPSRRGASARRRTSRTCPSADAADPARLRVRQAPQRARDRDRPAPGGRRRPGSSSPPRARTRSGTTEASSPPSARTLRATDGSRRRARSGRDRDGAHRSDRNGGRGNPFRASPSGVSATRPLRRLAPAGTAATSGGPAEGSAHSGRRSTRP